MQAKVGSSDMSYAALLIIGNEILSGRTQDANLAFMGKQLADAGIRLAEARVVRDERAAVVTALNELRGRYDYVFSTGGIGPTHDDITTECVAAAFDVAVHRDPEAVARLQSYYGPNELTDARLKMAEVPTGAELIDNPISGAPGFRVDNVFVLPGIPRLMQKMFMGIVGELAGGPPITARSIKAWIAESKVAEDLRGVQLEHGGVDIGSYPFARENRFGTNLVVSGTDPKSVDGAVIEIERLLNARGIEHSVD
jgi:molybdenum cofactor synthesis domain-containing protein